MLGDASWLSRCDKYRCGWVEGGKVWFEGRGGVPGEAVYGRRRTLDVGLLEDGVRVDLSGRTSARVFGWEGREREMEGTEVSHEREEMSGLEEP